MAFYAVAVHAMVWRGRQPSCFLSSTKFTFSTYPSSHMKVLLRETLVPVHEHSCWYFGYSFCRCRGYGSTPAPSIFGLAAILRGKLIQLWCLFYSGYLHLVWAGGVNANHLAARCNGGPTPVSALLLLLRLLKRVFLLF